MKQASTQRIDSNTLTRGMVIELGPNDFRTVTGFKTELTGSCAVFLDDSEHPLPLPAHVNVKTV